jgi:hypothetical protein
MPGPLSLSLLIAAGAVATFVIARRLLVCRHPGPLGLMPPTDNGEGGRTRAQWFCDRCGKSWPAGLEQEEHIIQRFTGYDESKAVAARKRADELAKRQRSLAVGRAGQAVKPRVDPPKPDVERKAPVPIHGRRMVG